MRFLGLRTGMLAKRFGLSHGAIDVAAISGCRGSRWLPALSQLVHVPVEILLDTSPEDPPQESIYCQLYFARRTSGCAAIGLNLRRRHRSGRTKAAAMLTRPKQEPLGRRRFARHQQSVSARSDGRLGNRSLTQAQRSPAYLFRKLTSAARPSGKGALQRPFATPAERR